MKKNRETSAETDNCAYINIKRGKLRILEFKKFQNFISSVRKNSKYFEIFSKYIFTSTFKVFIVQN